MGVGEGHQHNSRWFGDIDPIARGTITGESFSRAG